MFENIKNIFKRSKKRELLKSSSKDTAKERLHLVLMQDRANVSADFLDLMRQEIVEVIKKYIDIDEDAMDVRLGAETNEDGTQGAPALYANIPIINIKDETRQMSKTNQDKKIIEQEVNKKEIKNVTTNPSKKPEKTKEEEPKEQKETKEEIKESNEKEKEKKETKQKENEKKETSNITKENEKEEKKNEKSANTENKKEEKDTKEPDKKIEKEKKDEK